MSLSLTSMCVCLHILNEERPWSQRQPSPRVQGGRRPEVPLHPPSLWRVQGRLGLADLVGNLLRGHHRSLQRLLHCCGDARGRRLGGAQPPECQRHLGGDTFHHWWGCFQKFCVIAFFFFLHVYDFTCENVCWTVKGEWLLFQNVKVPFHFCQTYCDYFRYMLMAELRRVD